MGVCVNESLIGQPGSRARMATPALIIDLPAFEANVATMAACPSSNNLRQMAF